MFTKCKRIINVVVYCFLFRSKQRRIATALETQRADLLMMQMVHKETFADLFSKHEDNSGKDVKHVLTKYSPFADCDNTMSLHGQFNETASIEDRIPSIVLSAKHPAVVLMLRKMHEENHYEGTVYVINLVEQQF